jgi:hypothetical protein
MSGKPWSDERKAAFSEQQKARWRDPKLRKAARERGRKIMTDPAMLAAKSELMKALNERMRTDETLKKKCVKGQKRVRRRKRFRAKQSAAMRQMMRKPENRERARQHAIAIDRDPKIRAKQWASRRRKAMQPKPVQAPPPPQIKADPNAIFLQLLAREAKSQPQTRSA